VGDSGALSSPPEGWDAAGARHAKADAAATTASPGFGRLLSAAGSPGESATKSKVGQGQGGNVWENIPGPSGASQSELEDTESTTTASSVAVSEHSKVKRSASSRIGEALLGARRPSWRGSPEMERRGPFASGIRPPRKGPTAPPASRAPLAAAGSGRLAP